MNKVALTWLLGKEIADYFNNPLVKAGQFTEGLFKSRVIWAESPDQVVSLQRIQVCPITGLGIWQ